jgi:Na+-translocating ferredoxin:NAD+ oxidoreductase RnfG subunit
MNRKRTVFLFILLAFCTYGFSQSVIDYKNKALLKALQKSSITDFAQISEIGITETIRDRYDIHGKFFEIKSNGSQYKYIYVGRVNSCRAGGCVISPGAPHNADSEYFDYFILFDKNKTVQFVQVFNYQATHGHEICTKGWLKQFIGHNGTNPLQVNKNIDTISGATISVYAITADVETKTALLTSL